MPFYATNLHNIQYRFPNNPRSIIIGWSFTDFVRSADDSSAVFNSDEGQIALRWDSSGFVITSASLGIDYLCIDYACDDAESIEDVMKELDAE